MKNLEWRGVRFERYTMGGQHVCWRSPFDVWKVEQYREGDVWYARLKLGCHRFNGEGDTATDALEQARSSGFDICVALEQALEGTSGYLTLNAEKNGRKSPEQGE